MIVSQEKQFKINPRSLRPNHLFMDIHKDKMERHRDGNEDAFTRFRNYKSKINLLFSDLPHEHKFWLRSGASIKNLHELYEEFNSMSDAVFAHHVTRHNNDFAEWIRHVYQDEELSASLLRAKTRKEAKRAIENRIDALVLDVDKHPNEKGFFNALIQKLTKQNEKLEKDLLDKKNWMNRKQSDLETWEAKNIEHEKKLLNKYKIMEHQEQHLYDKFKKLQEQEERLNTALSQEKREIERQKKELEQQRHEHEAMKRSTIFKKHEPIYTRLDELMSYATTCVINKNYKEARDSMSKVKYYYNTLPNEDPKKKDFYAKIIKLRSHVKDALRI